MPVSLSPHLDSRQRDLSPREGFQQTSCRGLIRLSFGLTFVQPGQRLTGFVQLLVNLGFYQRHHSQGQRQQVSQADNLVVGSDIQRADSQRMVFDHMALTQRHPLNRDTGDVNPKALSMFLLLNGFFVAGDFGNHVADLHHRPAGVVWTSPSPLHVAHLGIWAAASGSHSHAPRCQLGCPVSRAAILLSPT